MEPEKKKIELKMDLNELAKRLTKAKVSTLDIVRNQDARMVSIKGKDSGGLFLGNKGINLPNGEYVNAEELKEALESALEAEKVKHQKGTKNEVIVDPESLENFNEAITNASKIVFSTMAVTNQDARVVAIQEEGKTAQKNAGGVFLGNKGVKLPNGEYVTVPEVEFALIELIKPPVLTPEVEELPVPTPQVEPPPVPTPQEEKPLVPTPYGEKPLVPIPYGETPLIPTPQVEEPSVLTQQEEKPKKMKVVKRKLISPLIAATITVLIIAQTLATSFYPYQDNKVAAIPTKQQPIIGMTLEYRAEPEIIMESEIIETEEPTIEEAIEEEMELMSPRIGDVIILEEGFEYHIASDRRDISGTIGRPVRETGAYTVDGLSFIGPNGRIVSTSFKPGANALEIKAELEARGYEIFRIEIHYNQGPSLSRDAQTGWAPLTDDLLYNWSNNFVDNIAPQEEILELEDAPRVR